MVFKKFVFLAFLTASAICSAKILPEPVSGFWDANVLYEIWLPNRDEPVSFQASLLQQPNDLDSMSPCNYLIVWEKNDRNNDEEINFTSYFDGNFYRFKDDKLDHFTLVSDSVQFESGIFWNEMFVNLLPTYIGEFFNSLSSDSAFCYSVITRDDGSIDVNGKETRRGWNMKHFSYSLSSDGFPLSSEITLNPDNTNEQIVSTKYFYPSTLKTDTIPLSESRLADLFPEQFNKFSSDKLDISGMIGRPMPSFSLPLIPDGRISHQRGQHFSTEGAVFIFMENLDFSLIKELKAKVSEVDNIIFVLTDSRPDNIEDGNNREIIAYRGGQLSKRCGINVFPTIIFCSETGIIERFENLD